MKKLIILILLPLITISCMNNKQSIAKKHYLPEDFFDGKDLKMGQAIYDGNTRDIEWLVKNQNYNVNGRGNKIRKARLQRFTYLVYAVLIEELESAKKLLELGADVDLVSFNGRAVYTAINFACSNKNKPMVELLLKYKVNLNPPISESPIDDLLIGDEDKSMIELLLNSGANINFQSYIGGDTPIMTALELSKFEYVHYFLDRGADPLIIESGGNSFAYSVQKELEEGRLTDYGLNEYNKIKDRLVKEFHVKFPLKLERKRAMEESIQRYEKLSQSNKELLGETETKRIQKYRDSIAKGVDFLGRTFESYNK